MLVARSHQGRITSQKCVTGGVLLCRLYTRHNGKASYEYRSWRAADSNPLKSGGQENASADGGKKDAGPSLYEQLFPDQHEVEVKKQRESDIPRLPVSDAAPTFRKYGRGHKDEKVTGSRAAWELQKEMAAEPTRISVLVLRNASKNLVEEDFKRIIPQGKHLPGWKLEQGDILQVVPGRDLETGEQTNYYYLLFSSPISAFMYQRHATRIHRLVAAHTPASVLSAIPPPPGLMIDGMDAHAAMRSFSLVPPTQSIDLRQLNPPLPSVLEQIIRNKGYAAITARKGRSPYEARLTFEGPQLHMSAVKHVLVTSAKDRGLSWSGGESLAPTLTKWEPHWKNYDHREHDPNDPPIGKRTEVQDHEPRSAPERDQQKKRTPLLVYIAGFQTERAMQSFVHYWHRRPMEVQSSQWNSIEAADLPPIANVEVLW